MAERTSRGRLRRRLLAAAAAVVLAGAIAGAFVLAGLMREGAALARVHARHEVSHPGWSFPGRIYSRAVALDLPGPRLIAEAKARGYLENCAASPPPPGTYCEATGAVTPRSGNSLEPVLLGWLIGPDAEVREHLPLHDAPPHLVHALLAAEDRDFWKHSGVNLRAMVRATFANLQEGSYAQGGSTLSMQVVRSLSQRKEKTPGRKLQEMGLAMGLERELGKRGVLQMYLDIPYLGQRGGLSICGFAAASRHYFGKDVRSLTKAEAATLVAILPSPANLGPKIGSEELTARTRRVLLAMRDVFGEHVDDALEETVRAVEPPPLEERHPAYLSATRLWLEAELPPKLLYGSGLVVETAIDLPLQEDTDERLAQMLRRYEARMARYSDDPLQAAGVALEPDTGLIRAVFGGPEATSTGLNRALQSRRQAGSSFKPVLFALAFSEREANGERRFTAADTQPNRPRVFKTPEGPWRPRNIGSEYSDTCSLAFALVWSQNVATASLLDALGGPSRLIDFASRLGFDASGYPHELGLALGQAETTPLEMAEFVGLLANGGHRVRGRTVVRAVDATGAERVHPPRRGPQVLDAEAAALTRELMRQVIEQGTGTTIRGSASESGYQGAAFGKTGTTDAERDVWFVGASPAVAMSLWVGYDQPARVGGTAMDLAAPLWGYWMSRAMAHEERPLKFPADPALVTRWICAESGRLAAPGCRAVGAPFVPGTQPKDRCMIAHPMPAAH